MEKPEETPPPGGADDGDEGPKWACEYCTYLNFRSSVKCTLCRAPKPSPRIEELAHSRDLPTHVPERASPVTTTGDTAELLEKWSCPVCTYANWPRSRKCVQCRLNRPMLSASPPPTTSKATPGTELKMAVPSSLIGAEKTTASSGSSSPKTTLLSLGPSTSTSLEPRMLAKKLSKWTCPACTYENWQKASTCVMCYSSRPGATSTTVLQRRGRGAPGEEASPPPRADKKRSWDAEGKEEEADKEEKEAEGSGRKSPKSSSSGSSTENLAVAAASATLQERKEGRLERALRRLRQDRRHVDFLWLSAVRSVATSAFDSDPAEAFLAAGGEPTRALTQTEAALLSHALSAAGHKFEPGLTLIHLAVKYGRDDLIALLLASSDPATAPLNGPGNPRATGSSGVRSVGSGGIIKRVPCHVNPNLSADIRRAVSLSLRQRKGDFPCFYFTEMSTFSLPLRIRDLAPYCARQLWSELLDQHAQAELEEEAAIVNWAPELADGLGSRLYALWNRTAGDCLLDSVLQATWGIFDSENSLRQALYDSLQDAANSFFPRWREYESVVAARLGYALDESQLARDWSLILQLASKPGSALEQAHILVLAHIIRRPIIVYGVKVVKSWRGEQLDFARFQGIYLPLQWEPGFCASSPIALGYTPGHFSALVPIAHGTAAAASDHRHHEDRAPRTAAPLAYLPLQDVEGAFLPIHFLRRSEVGSEKELLRSWLDVVRTESGLFCAKMKLARPPAIVGQMVEEWLEFYRRLPPIYEAGPASSSALISAALPPPSAPRTVAAASPKDPEPEPQPPKPSRESVGEGEEEAEEESSDSDDDEEEEEE